MPTGMEVTKAALDDFKKIQEYMVLAKKENAVETYAKLKKEYLTIKALLNVSGVNLTDIDEIKENPTLFGKNDRMQSGAELKSVRLLTKRIKALHFFWKMRSNNRFMCFPHKVDILQHGIPHAFAGKEQKQAHN